MDLRVWLAVGALCLSPGSAWAGSFPADAVRAQFELTAQASARPIAGSYADAARDTGDLFTNPQTDPPVIDGTIFYGILSAGSRSRTTGAPTLPEPGSILLALGAASLLALRRR